MLKYVVEKQKDDIKVVQWYIDVLEDGKDTRELVGLYYEVNKKHKELQTQYSKMQKRLEAEVEKGKKKITEIQLMLKK